MTDISEIKVRAANGTRDEQIAAYLDLVSYYSGEGEKPDAMLQLIFAKAVAKLGSADGMTAGVKLLSQNAKAAKKITDKCEYLGEMTKAFPITDMEALGCDKALAIAGTAYEDMAITLVGMARRASARTRSQYVEASVGYFIQAYDAYETGNLCAESTTITKFCSGRMDDIGDKLKAIAATIVAHGQIHEERADRARDRKDHEQAQPFAQEARRNFAFVVERLDGITAAEPMVLHARRSLDRVQKNFPDLAPEKQPARSKPPRAGQKPSRDMN